MKYNKTVILKNGEKCLLKSADAADGAEVLDVFLKTHEETDHLLTYVDENTFTAENESEFLKEKAESENSIEIAAVVDGKIAGTAGIEPKGSCFKLRHRAEFGVAILKSYWGLGIGKALTAACIECAKKAGYTQLELDVVADNASAAALYKSLGFEEFGRNPRGFNSRISGYTELVDMRLEL